jgi:diguanylate cyclase (GGDEF)-like protein
MTIADEKPTRVSALGPAISDVNQSDREIRRLRLLLLVLMLVEVIAVFVSRVSNQWRGEFGFLPQILIGFVVLALIFTLHLAAQRKLLREVSTALIAASSYVDRLEQISLIDPPTQLFNRRYLDELFNHQLKWVNRSGKSATLLLLEVLPNEQNANAAAEEIVIEAAFILRSNFRGSDYVMRYSTDQFLVVLPDTNEQQAQIALSRLIDKVDYWNRANEKRGMALRLALSTCPPDGNLWEKLSAIEKRMENKSEAGVRTLSPPKPTANDAVELRPHEQLIQ